MRCIDAPSTWVEFSETFEEVSSRKAMKQMDTGKHFSISVGVVLEGRLTGYGGGYGHMNGYQLAFTIDRIDSAKRLDNRGFHRRALSPEDRKRIEQYEGIGAIEQRLERTRHERASVKLRGRAAQEQRSAAPCPMGSDRESRVGKCHQRQLVDVSDPNLWGQVFLDRA